MTKRLRFLLPSVLFCFGTSALAADPVLYYGGDILTMEGEKPHYEEALVESEGRIVYLGSLAKAREKFDNLQNKDLQGKTLLPGFLDAHSHMYNTGLIAQLANLLPPPDGPGANFNSLVTTTKKWMESAEGKFIIGKFGWVLANGYDDSQLSEKQHPTKDVLDKISSKYPVLIMHQSGHLASVNSKALEVGGYTKDTKDPKGGVIRRLADNSPNGVLEEAAFFNLLLPIVATKSDAEVQQRSIELAQLEYAKNGYLTAQDGRTTADATSALERAAREKSLFIDVVSYPDIVWNKSAVKPEFYNSDRSYVNRYRIGGVKLTLDGSPQGKTAWLSSHYHTPPEGKPLDYKGYPIMSDEMAIKHINTAFKNKWQIIAHTNGDAAIDQYIKAIKVAKKSYGYDDHRSVMIHGQTLRKDQIPDLVDLGILPSLFPMHTFYWGDWHVESVLGHPRADYISPSRDVVEAGLTVTSHHDAPVTFPNSMRVLDATVNRITRSGKVLGPDQRLTPYEGLKTLTQWAAIQYFEEASKGTLAEGKLADFVILSNNPLKVEPLTIKDIKIVQSIKEGHVVYSN